TFSDLAALSMKGRKIMAAPPGRKRQILHLQLRCLGHARTGVVVGEQEGVFVLSPVRLPVRHREHRLHLRPRQPANRWLNGLFGRDGADMPTPLDMCRVPATHKARKGLDAREPLVPGPNRASAVVLDMSEELQNQR